jgi:P27 family predicted phage terminase small subunit
MGRRGPNPKPTQLKILEGNPGKRPLVRTKSRLSNQKVSCPEWLSRTAKEEWRRLAPELDRLGYLTRLDRAAFACYCSSYGHWRECQDAIDRHGPMYLTARGRLTERPEVQMAKQHGQMMKAFATEFGLTPNSRARMGGAESNTGEDCCQRCSLPLDLCGCS